MPHLSTFRLFLLGTTLLAGALLPGASAALNAQEQAIADLLASASGQGRRSVRVDPILSRVARARAADMAQRDYFAHVNPDGHGPNYLVRRAGYSLPPVYGTSADANNVESIAAGRESASATWSDWMGSPGHKRHLLAESSFYAEQTSIGVGYAYDAGSQYRAYWVVISAPPNASVLLTMATPISDARVNSDSVTVTGTTDGAVPIHAVRARVENAAGDGAYQNAAGTGTWSVELDGLRPGRNTIRVQALDASGKILTQMTRMVQYVVERDLLITVSGEGRVTEGFSGSTSRALGKAYTIKAAPAAGWLFSGWSGGVPSARAKLTFTMTEGLALTATFIPNPFIDRKGTYIGLLLPDGARSVETTGRVQIDVNGAGVFSGQIMLGGKRHSVKGKFDTAGVAGMQLGRSGTTVELRLDVEGASGVSAIATQGGATSTAVATLGFRNGTGGMNAGRYTVSIPRNPAETNVEVPAGDGYATLRVSTSGQGQLTGSLADGSSFSIAGSFGADGAMTIYKPLYKGAGVLAGTLRFAETEVSDLEGYVLWIKPAGFTTDAPLVGCRFEPPGRGETIFEVAAGENNAALFLEAGDLAEPVTQPVTLDSGNRVTLSTQELDGLRVKVHAATGTYSGSFVHPTSGAKTRIGGAIFQKQNAGFGYFLGQQASGYTSLAPAE